MFNDVLNLSRSRTRVATNRISPCCSFDLESFKNINDTLATEAGDRLLQEMGVRLPKRCARADVVARLGGERFVVRRPRKVSEARQVEAVARKVLSPSSSRW